MLPSDSMTIVLSSGVVGLRWSMSSDVADARGVQGLLEMVVDGYTGYRLACFGNVGLLTYLVSWSVSLKS